MATAPPSAVATMRDIAGRNQARADTLRALAAKQNIQLHPLELDVLSQDSANAAAATILREQGCIDVVVQNAARCRSASGGR